MRATLITLFFIFTSGASAADCYLSETGKTKFTAMNLIFCGNSSCVEYTRLNGTSGQEELKFTGCGGRWCLQESKSFQHVFPSSGRDTEYVSDKGGNEVYLICPP